MTRDEQISKQEKDILRDSEEKERLLIENLKDLSHSGHRKYFEYFEKDYNDTYEFRAAIAIVKGICIPIIKPYHSCPDKIIHHFFIRFICSKRNKNAPYPKAKDFLDYYFDSRP